MTGFGSPNEDSPPESISADNLSIGDLYTKSGQRPSVLKSLQDTIYEDMENRRLLNCLINSGKTEEAIKKLEEFYPNMLSCNKQMNLLLKIQQYVEMLLEIAKVNLKYF